MTNHSEDARVAGGPESWLRSPLPHFISLLMPAAHALLQAAGDIEGAASALSPEDVWRRPGGAPSVGFHLRHVAGSIDRLLTYARGDQLGEDQLRASAAESSPGKSIEEAVTLVRAAGARIEDTLRVLRSTPEGSLGEPREVGRGRRPSTVFGLLFHIAEHTERHAGQIVTTARVVRGEVFRKESSGGEPAGIMRGRIDAD